MTVACSSSVSPGNIGSDSVRAADPVGDRQVGADPQRQHVRLAMDRDRVVDAGRHPGRGEVGDDRVARRPDLERVLVVDVRPVRRPDRHDDRQVGERRVVAGRDRLPPRGVALELVELAQPDRRGDVGQAEVVAEDLVAVPLAHALVAVQPDPVGQARRRRS